jgi:hypothetical protein
MQGGVPMKIIPYTSVGSLKLQMTSEEISAQLNEEPRRFKHEEEETLSDHYKKADVHVHYNHNGTCTAIELVDEATPEINGIRFLNMPAKKAKKILNELDDHIIEISDTFISNSLGISLYIPYEKVETVLVFEKGYYDELLQLLKEMDEEL